MLVIVRIICVNAAPIYNPSRIHDAALIFEFEDGIMVADDVCSRRSLPGRSRVFECNLDGSSSCHQHAGRIAGWHGFEIMACDELP